MKTVLFAAASLHLAVFMTGCTQKGEDRVSLFVAASLTDVAEDLVRRFEAQQPRVPVEINVAASSTLARQIALGAPADLFLSADVDWVEYLKDRGHIVNYEILEYSNEIVLVWDEDKSPPLEWPGLGYRIAVGDPDHVPIGKYLRRAAICDESWSILQGRIVPVPNARAAIMAVRSGAAQAAVVYKTDGNASNLAVRNIRFSDGCEPIVRYAIARTSSTMSPVASERLQRFLTDPDQADVWTANGFSRTDSGSR